jgi:hypothetical protein
MVDEYPACPTNWMHGSGTVKSYFVPIQPEHGMWLDLNGCSNHTHHIAALISVQGVNPLTGQPLIDTAMRLEQYKNKCPKHDKEFGADLYCEECGYKWVPQNYLATTGTPLGQFWLDGFRADDGAVRQYYFTEEEAKGVATQVIGDKRVYAIGIAFYKSKTEKPNQAYAPRTVKLLSMGSKPSSSWGAAAVMPDVAVHVSRRSFNRYRGSGQSQNKSDSGLESLSSVTPEAVSMNYAGDSTTGFDDYEQTAGGIKLRDSNDFIDLPVKQLEIGAGAKINQRVYRDPENLDFWEDKPIGMLYINYVDEGAAKRIIAIGKKDMTKKGEGFLAGLTVGKK